VRDSRHKRHAYEGILQRRDRQRETEREREGGGRERWLERGLKLAGGKLKFTIASRAVMAEKRERENRIE